MNEDNKNNYIYKKLKSIHSRLKTLENNTELDNKHSQEVAIIRYQVDQVLDVACILQSYRVGVRYE